MHFQQYTLVLNCSTRQNILLAMHIIKNHYLQIETFLTSFTCDQITIASSAACLIARLASSSAATLAPPIKCTFTPPCSSAR